MRIYNLKLKTGALDTLEIIPRNFKVKYDYYIESETSLFCLFYKAAATDKISNPRLANEINKGDYNFLKLSRFAPTISFATDDKQVISV